MAALQKMLDAERGGEARARNGEAKTPTTPRILSTRRRERSGALMVLSAAEGQFDIQLTDRSDVSAQ